MKYSETIKDGSEPQWATAQAQAEQKLKNTDKNSNKIAYLVVAEDAESKTNIAYYLSHSCQSKSIPETCSLFGFSVNTKQVKELGESPTWSAVAEYAEENDMVLMDLQIPWHRIIKIKNLNYKSK